MFRKKLLLPLFSVSLLLLGRPAFSYVDQATTGTPSNPGSIRLLLKLNETSGTTAFDSSGLSNDGTLNNFPASPPWSGTALTFDGNNDYISVPDDPTLGLTTAITVEAWLYMTSRSGVDSIFSQWAGGGQKSWLIDVNGSGRIRCTFSPDGNSKSQVLGPSVPINEWMNIACVYDSSVPIIELWVDGVFVDSKAGPAVIHDSTAPVEVGSSDGADKNSHFTGSIDQVRILNFRRTDFSQRLIYHNNETSGTLAEDATGFANDGNLNNFPGTPWTSTGARFDNGLDFDGSNDYVQVIREPALDFTDAVTLEAWINLTVDPVGDPRQYIISKYNTTGDQRAYSMLLDNGANDDQIRCQMSSDGTFANTVLLWSASTIPDNTLTHVACTYDGTDMFVYINGVQDGTIAGPASLFDSTADVLVGTRLPLTASTYADGVIDEVRLLDYSRTGFNGGVVMNEVEFDASSGNEWIELYNGGGSAIDIQGWEFSDTAGNTYTVPNNGFTSIAAGSYLCIEIDSSSPAADTASIFYTGNDAGNTLVDSSLDNTDTLSVYPDTDNTYTNLIDFVAWGADPGTADDQANSAGLWVRETYIDYVPAQTDTVGLLADGNNEEGMLDWTPYVLGSGCGATNSTGVPNAVDLSEFRAEGHDGAVAVTWTTEAELDNLGFNLYRKDCEGCEYLPVNGFLILGMGSTDLRGRYLFVDETVANGVTYSYLLEDVEFDGDATFHGPVSAMPLAEGGAVEIEPEEFVNVAGTADSSGPFGGGGSSSDEGVSEGGGDSPTEGSAWGWQVAAGEAPGYEVVSSNASSMVIEIRPPLPEFEQVFVEGDFWTRVSMAGYGWTSEPGHPAVPSHGFLIPVPDVARVDVELLEVETGEVAGLFDVEPAPDVVFDGTSFVPVFVLDEAAYAEDVFLPKPYTAYAGSGVVGDGRVALLRVQPFRWNPVSGEARFAKRLLVRLEFSGVGVGLGDEVTASESNQFAVASEGAVKLRVTEPGVYRVTYDDLAGVGFDVLSDPRDWHLLTEGEEVSVEVLGEWDGSFDPGDALLFYGEPVETRYGVEGFYWLSVGNTPGLRVGSVDVSPVSGSGPVSYPETVRVEENTVYEPVYRNGEVENFFGPWVFLSPRNVPFSIDALDPSGEAVLRSAFQGVTVDPLDPDHHHEVSLNGAFVDDALFDGQEYFTSGVMFGAGTLFEGPNTVTVTPVTIPGVLFDLIYIDYFELVYPRFYETPVGDASWRFSSEGGGALRLHGLGTDAVDLFDVTDPYRPVRLTGAVAEMTGPGEYDLVFESPAAGLVSYVTELSAQAPEVMLDTPSALSASSGADYVVISHADFIPSLDPLAAHREGQGLSVLVADVEDVYDEFGFGRFSPEAIRDFLAYAFFEWDVRPRYVLLVGDATFDYKDYLGGAKKNFVPTYLLDTGFSEAASDTWMAAVMGNDVLPDVALGRFSVETAAEADALVAKTIGYETASAAGDWHDRALLVADDGKFDGNDAERLMFEGTQLLVADSIAGSASSDLLFLGDYDDAELPGAASADMLGALDAGRLYVSYFGHGASGFWADEIVFHSDDVAGLDNGDRLPVVATYNCLNGFFTSLSGDSLAEVMTRADGRGAVAFWSSTAVTSSEAQSRLARAFSRSLFTRDVTLGEAVQEAFTALSFEPATDDTIRTWALFGDPALHFQHNRPPVASITPVTKRGNKRLKLDGGKCYDPEGVPLTYSWRLLDRPNRSKARIRFPTSKVTKMRTDRKGNYVVELTVSDGEKEATATTTITVSRKQKVKKRK